MTNENSDAWRAIVHPSGSGAWNMAVDEAILEAAGAGLVPPTLRLYAWSPPCLSLGYAQPASDVDLSRLAASGWELVRRPTGGRAILHTDELTYSITGSVDEPRLVGSVIESYQRLSQALLLALDFLAVPASAHPNSPSQEAAKGPVCFEVPSNYEITFQGKKLIGSAQARRKEGVLQHGTLPLHGDLSRITQALVFPDEASRQQAAARVLSRAATLESVLGRPVPFAEAAQAFVKAFEQALHLRLEPGELTPSELERSRALAEQKYAHSSWTLREIGERKPD